MSSITVNTFPSLHSFTSPRSWFLAIIVLMHLGFFWVLSNGLSQQILGPIIGSVMVPVPADLPQTPPKPTSLDNKPIEPDRYDRVTVPEPEHLVFQDREEVIGGDVVKLQPYPPATVAPEPRRAVIVEPAIDPRRGLTEPVYPSVAIRMNQTGTVLLSVQVLENGRVGQVRIEQSSGHSRLDDAAVREARLWRFVPGTHDGVPMVMWKQVPITFRLQN